MSFNFGSSDKKDKGTTQIVLPPASASEEELRRLNVEAVKKQLAAIDQADADQRARESSPLGQMQKQLEEKATQNLLARVTGQAPVLSPEEQARLDEIFGVTQRRGQESISQFARDLASSRGLSVSDSPIGGEALKQQRELVEGLGAQKSQSALDLGNAAADFNARLTAFQNNLRQQAFMNRLALASTTPTSFGLQSTLFNERAAGAPRQSTGFSNISSNQFGFNGTDIGRLLSGYGDFRSAR